MFIPFLLATTCVVLAAASQFHAKPFPGLVERVDGILASNEPVSDKLGKEYLSILSVESKQTSSRKASKQRWGKAEGC
ncbi:MAG: hypothetical protein R3C11_28225 [Planctomycetaceae bacterium]